MALIRPFVPAKDFARSRDFYAAIGFTEHYADETLAILEFEGAGILLQDLYEPAWAENTMLQLFVSGLDHWWQRTAGLVEQFGVQPPRAPAAQPWGLRVGYLWDPSGVLWQVSEETGSEA
ncbi:Glyoxalase [Sphingomonas antarctica]|uniref:glyoxalase n=1 Tax=Sphingomonas antarctica TaxID=2040274 RepID=UPI0039EB6867